MIWMLLGSALAGDLWLDIEATKDDGEVRLHLPANDLLDEDATSDLTVNGDRIDLPAEARALAARGRGEKRIPIDDGVMVLRLLDPPKKADAVKELVLGLKGPLGMGLDLSFPLDGSGDLAKLDENVGSQVALDGVDLSFGDDDLAQLRRAGPVELVRVVGPEGGGLVVSTR